MPSVSTTLYISARHPAVIPRFGGGVIREVHHGTLSARVLPGLAAKHMGQIGYLWEPDELQRVSELIVVGTPLGTRDTGNRRELTELKPPLAVIELLTEFRVLSVLKGTISDSTLQLRHYRLDDATLARGCLNCGGQIRFGSDASGTPLCRVGDASSDLPSRCDYLLYLRREDNVFAPTSGHVSPGDAVFLVRRAG